MGARRAQSVAELADTRRMVPGDDGRPGAEADCGADGDGAPETGTGETRQEVFMARGIRAQCLADGLPPAEIALAIHERCTPTFGTTLIRAHRLALGIALADVVAQVRARYVTEGRLPPRFSETLLSSYESGQKRPGPEYLHYLCNVYQAEPADLGYPGQCLCGRTHRAPALVPGAAGTGTRTRTGAGAGTRTEAGTGPGRPRWPRPRGRRLFPRGRRLFPRRRTRPGRSPVRAGPTSPPGWPCRWPSPAPARRTTTWSGGTCSG